MNTNRPKDIQTAMRHALRLERAKAILEAGYTFSEDKDLDTIFVCKPGRLFADYQIASGKCDCPDFAEHKDVCKHTLALEIKNAEDTAIDAQAAQYAEEQFLNPLPN